MYAFSSGFVCVYLGSFVTRVLATLSHSRHWSLWWNIHWMYTLKQFVFNSKLRMYIQRMSGNLKMKNQNSVHCSVASCYCCTLQAYRVLQQWFLGMAKFNTYLHIWIYCIHNCLYEIKKYYSLYHGMHKIPQIICYS